MSSTNTVKIRKFYSDNVKRVQVEPIKQDIYAVIGKDSLWANEIVPDVINDSRLDRISFYADIIGGKKISPTDSIKVARRIDWTSGTIYDYYDDSIDLVFGESKTNPSSPSQFYVLSSNLDVYKCLDNNNNTQSTIEPSGQLSNSFVTLDGYRWKYMYTITSSQETDYITPEWMPIQTLDTLDGSSQWNTQVSAVSGAIEHIQVVSGGSGYNSLDLPNVTITGDGVGATATATIDDSGVGVVSNIVITSMGSGYTNATVSVSGNTGNSAIARVILSPENGHGSDAASELGGVFDMMIVRFIDNEGGKIPTGISYRKVGLLLNPKTTEDGYLYELSGITGDFIDGESATGPSGTGTVIKFLGLEDKVYFRVVTGTFSNSETIVGDTSAISGVISTQTQTKLPITSNLFGIGELATDEGDVLYMENLVAINRLVGQVELLQFVLL